MEIEKQRGISVTSSVMQFQYEGYCINILDTPGPSGLFRGHLPHADGGGLRRHGHRRAPRASSRRPASCSRSAPCAISRSLPLSTKWTARRATRSSCCDEIEKELGIETYAGQLAHRLRQGVSRASMTAHKRQIICFSRRMATARTADSRSRSTLDDPQLDGADRRALHAAAVGRRGAARRRGLRV